MASSVKYLNLESLRGIAAMSVVFYHFNIGSHFNSEFTKNAWIMVDFFFVLSGFVIALNYRDRFRRLADIWRFQRKRFLRLYPLHFAMLMVFLLIECAKYFAQTQFEIFANDPAFSQNSLGAFVAHIFLLQNWVLSALTFNGPSWSISAEFYTYIIFAFLAYAARNSQIAFYGTVIAVIIGAGFLLQRYGFGTDNIAGPARCLYGFFIGVVCCAIFQKRAGGQDIDRSHIASGLLLLCLISIIYLDHLPSDVYLYMPMLFSICIFALVRTSQNAWINRILSTRALVYLGTISYGVYMIHKVVWWFMHQTLRFVFHFPTHISSTGRLRVQVDNPFVADAISLFGVVIIVALAHLSYQKFERKMIAPKP